MVIRITITRARANKDGVTIDVTLLALDGPYAGASLDKQFFYSHPTSPELIVEELTDFANMLKISLDSPGGLEGMEFEV